MSFTLREMRRWLERGGVAVELVRADGRPLEEPAAVEDVELRAASLDSRHCDETTLFVGVAGERTHGGRFLAEALTAGAPTALVEGPLAAVASRAEPVLVVADGRSALEHIARGYLRRFAPVVVGITGSNGKTTTKDLLRAALADVPAVGSSPGNLNSRWGVPLAILAQTGDERILVLEMGASAPGEIGHLASIAPPTIGCITNVAPAHLERFGSVEAVAQTKSQLLEALPAEGVAVLCRDDPCFDTLRRRSAAARCISFGRSAKSDVRVQLVRQHAEGLFVRIDGDEVQLPLFGESNALNAAAALTMARELGVDSSRALAAMAEVQLSPHRSRLVHVAQRTFIDDCYNANPASMRAALQSLLAIPVRGRRIAVLGTMAELGPGETEHHRALLREVAASALERVHVVGAAMSSAAAEIDQDGARIQVWDEDRFEAFRQQLRSEIRAGDAVLFKASRSVGLERVLEALLVELGLEEVV
jgi:UDP-N-acetylmuramoyl-tripeptide--D-alanyl-D-alanine ligase